MTGFLDSAPGVAPLSACLFAWDLRDGPDVRWATGGLMARTGHEGVWTRGGATLASVAAVGGTYTAPASMPAFETQTFDGVAQTALRMGTGDHVVWTPGFGPQAMTWWMTLVETGARVVANATLWSVANDAVSGVRLYLDTSGSFYRVTYHNGSTSMTATLASGAPTSGQSVLLWGTWAANGAVTINQRINGGGATSATSGALALPAAWASGTRIRLNRRGSTANPGQGAYQSLRFAPGILTESEMGALY